MLSLLPRALLIATLALPLGTHASETDSNSSEHSALLTGSLSDGIRYEINQNECGDVTRKPLSNWLCDIKIRGSLTDGTVFLDRTEEGNMLTLYPGFNNYEEALGLPFFPELSLIGPGGKIKLFVPAAVGFGDFKRGSVPPNSDLIYEIELVASVDLDAQEKIELEREEAYFKRLLAQNPNLVPTPSGICYEILDPGLDRKADGRDNHEITITVSLTDHTPLLKDEKLRLYRNFYNSTHGLVRRHLTELALIGKGGKLRLYIPFNQAFRHYKKPGIPRYSSLIYEIELTRAIDDITENVLAYARLDQNLGKNAEQSRLAPVPPTYSFFEEYPMLVRYPVAQGNCGCCWAMAATTTMTHRLGKELIDQGLTPPGIRKPVVRNGQVVGYDFPGEDTLDGYLSAQLVLIIDKERQGCDGSQALFAHVNIYEQYLYTSRLFPFLFPESNAEIPPKPKKVAQPATMERPLIPGGYSKKISGSIPEPAVGEEEMKYAIYMQGPITVTMRGCYTKDFMEHATGILPMPKVEFSNDPEKNEMFEYHFLCIVGWGIENGKKFWIVENSWGPLYFYDGIGPFSLENFSRGQLKVERGGNDFCEIEQSLSLTQEPYVRKSEELINSNPPKPNYDLDVYKDRYNDGFLRWPYLQPKEP